MTRKQFWILNGVSLLLVASLLAHYFLSRANDKLGNQLAQQRAFIANAQKAEAVLDQMAKRIAQGSEADPRLKTILIKYGLSVTLNDAGKGKSYP